MERKALGVPQELEDAIYQYIAVREACQAEYDRIKDTDSENAMRVWEPEGPAYEKFIEIKRKYA